jgi:hypothetical protein
MLKKKELWRRWVRQELNKGKILIFNIFIKIFRILTRSNIHKRVAQARLPMGKCGECRKVDPVRSRTPKNASKFRVQQNALQTTQNLHGRISIQYVGGCDME